MSSFFNDLREFIWLRRQGFRATEYIRDNDRISMHACGWRANGSGRMKNARDAVAYLEGAAPEQWRQIYCGMTPFLVSDRGNVRLIDGSEPKMFLANGRYQVAYKPEDVHPARRGRRGGMAHKKRVYRSVLVAMAFLDFKKGDEDHEVHHVNGYRTDDRLVNLMVLTHDEHTRIHSMGPCGLTAPVDEAVQKAGLLAEMKPEGKLKLRRMKKKALENALAEPKKLPAAAQKDGDASHEALQSPKQEAPAAGNEAERIQANEGSTEQPSASNKLAADEHHNAPNQAKPDRSAITPAEAPLGTYAFAPLPVLDETGTFTTPEAPEIAAAKQEKAQAEAAEMRKTEEQAAAEAAALAAIPARGEHKAEEKSSLQTAAEQGMAEVSEKLEGAQVRSGAKAQESLNGEGPSKSAKRRASKKRAEQRRAEAKAVREEAAAEVEREQAAASDDNTPKESKTAGESNTATPATEAVQASSPEPEMATPRNVDEKTEKPAEAPHDAEANASAKAAESEARQPSLASNAASDAEPTEPKTAPMPKEKPKQTPKAGGATPEAQTPKAGQKPSQPTDWNALRANLLRETKIYVKAARKLSKQKDATDKQFAAVAKPVYKAFKPFLTCNDEVTAFDACLTCIRIIAQEADSAAKGGKGELPKSTYSLLGNFEKLLKTSVRKLMHNDEIVAACTEEMVREEAAKPLYEALKANPFQHCVNIVDSKKKTKAERVQKQPEENADSKPAQKKPAKPAAKKAEPAAAADTAQQTADATESAEAAPKPADSEREAEPVREAKPKERHAEGAAAPAEPAKPSHDAGDSRDQQTADNLREGNAPSTKRRNARRRSRTKRAKQIMEAKD